MVTTYRCRYCGKKFHTWKSRSKWGRGKHCSPRCQYSDRKTYPKSGITYICIGCGKSFYRPPSWASRKGAGKYCTRKCRDKNRIGKNHPQYLNGISSEKRGPNWQSQKHKALRRDKMTCQKCGGIGTDVHHIIPFRRFGISRYKEANRLGNLLTLCHSCHRKEDIKIQRLER